MSLSKQSTDTITPLALALAFLAPLPVGAMSRPRQTLLFSATFSKEVKEVAAVTLRKGYNIIDTVGEEVEQTHSHGEKQFAVTLCVCNVSLFCSNHP